MVAILKPGDAVPDAGEVEWLDGDGKWLASVCIRPADPGMWLACLKAPQGTCGAALGGMALHRYRTRTGAMRRALEFISNHNRTIAKKSD